MSTQKRKGSDFGATSATAVAASVNTSATTTSTTRFPLYGASSSSLDEDWQTLQDKMRQMREQFNTNIQNDPLMETIDDLAAKPRKWQDRIEALSYEAAAVEEKIDDEYQTLQDKWQQQSACERAHQERLATLRGTLEGLQLESDALQAALDQTHNALARQSEDRQRLRKAAEERMRTIVHKIPKLQQQISMYAMCTGIKWDYDNPDAWTGHVVSDLFCWLSRAIACYLIAWHLCYCIPLLTCQIYV